LLTASNISDKPVEQRINTSNIADSSQALLHARVDLHKSRLLDDIKVVSDDKSQLGTRCLWSALGMMA